jgi:hypothetical protein
MARKIVQNVAGDIAADVADVDVHAGTPSVWVQTPPPPTA